MLWNFSPSYLKDKHGGTEFILSRYVDKDRGFLSDIHYDFVFCRTVVAFHVEAPRNANDASDGYVFAYEGSYVGWNLWMPTHRVRPIPSRPLTGQLARDQGCQTASLLLPLGALRYP